MIPSTIILLQVPHVLIIELASAPLQQEALVRALLKSVAPNATISVLNVQDQQEQASRDL